MHARGRRQARRVQPRGLPARPRDLREGRSPRLREGARASHGPADGSAGRLGRGLRSPLPAARPSARRGRARRRRSTSTSRRARAVTSSTRRPGSIATCSRSTSAASTRASSARSRIDPLGLAQPGVDPVPGEDGATFAREGAILPELIATLHEARSAAMADGQRRALTRHQDPDELVLRRPRHAGLSVLRPAAADVDHPARARDHRAGARVLRGARACR